MQLPFPLKKGSHVVVLKSLEPSCAFVYGYGTFLEYCNPPQDVEWIHEKKSESEGKTAKIELDDGKIIYGCQCIYGHIDVMKKIMLGRTVVMVKN